MFGGGGNGVEGTPTKGELLGRLRQARTAWEATLAAVPRERLAEPGAAGIWSAVDVQAHLTTNNRWLTGQLRARRRGEPPTAEECYGHDHRPPPGTDLGDQDQRNAWWHSVDRERSPEEVLASAPRWADAMGDAITAVLEAELARPYTFADHGHVAEVRPAAGEFALPLWRIVASYADQHYAHHTAALRAWLGDGQHGDADAK